jgi:hypothetical protein
MGLRGARDGCKGGTVARRGARKGFKIWLQEFGKVPRDGFKKEMDAGEGWMQEIGPREGGKMWVQGRGAR